jgi:hypothetical protein
MSCDSCSETVKTITSQNRLVFSKGGSTAQGESDIFALSPAALMQLAPNLLQFRVTVALENLTENAEIELVFQNTNDGCLWSTNIVVDPTMGAAGWLGDNGVYTSAWYNTSANFLRGLRVGVIIRQSTGTGVEMGYATTVIDYELR